MEQANLLTTRPRLEQQNAANLRPDEGKLRFTALKEDAGSVLRFATRGHFTLVNHYLRDSGKDTKGLVRTKTPSDTAWETLTVTHRHTHTYTHRNIQH